MRYRISLYSPTVLCFVAKFPAVSGTPMPPTPVPLNISINRGGTGHENHAQCNVLVLCAPLPKSEEAQTR